MKSIEILGLILLFKFSFVTSYPGGAPTSACVYLLPRHGYPNIQPQTSPSPYSIHMSSGTYTPGKQLEVAIKAEGVLFNGWLLQVRRVDNNMTVGQFSSQPDGSKLISCNSANDAITHRNSYSFPNETLIVKWTAPDVDVGDIVLVGTVLQDYSTYWGPMKSNIVSLHPLPTTTTTTSSTTTTTVPTTTPKTTTTTQTTTAATTTTTSPTTSTSTSTTPTSSHTTQEATEQTTTIPTTTSTETTTTSTETTISSTTTTLPTKATSPTEQPTTTTQTITTLSQSTSSVSSTTTIGSEITSEAPVSSSSAPENTHPKSTSPITELVTPGPGIPPDSGEEENETNDDTGNSSPYTTPSFTTYCLLSLLCLLCNRVNILFI